jgi:multidrug efflux pump subunit AcrA (membrane-fusion protein)
MGIVSAPASAATYAPETAGYGLVLAHDVIAQAVADVATAEAAVHQSRAALARARNLAGTPGAFSAEAQETAQRQATADEAALVLARRKLSATFGQSQPWKDDQGSTMLDDVASGRTKLVRATFPLGALTGPIPRALQMARPDPRRKAERWKTDTVWAAPADATIPGRSLFALLKDGDVGEGERLDVWAVADTTESGVLVPQAAVVISDNKYWAYVEKEPGKFTRVAVDAGSPAPGGYFVKEGIAPGESIVVASAGLLLARETNPSTEVE